MAENPAIQRHSRFFSAIPAARALARARRAEFRLRARVLQPMMSPAEHDQIFGGVFSAFAHRFDVVKINPTLRTANPAGKLGRLALVLIPQSHLVLDGFRDGYANCSRA